MGSEMCIRDRDFGMVAKKNIIRGTSETGFLFGDGARVIRFFDGVIQQLGFWTQKI